MSSLMTHSPLAPSKQSIQANPNCIEAVDFTKHIVWHPTLNRSYETAYQIITGG